MKKLHNWILPIILLATFLPSIATAQCLIERCNQIKYEESRVSKLNLKLAHNEVKNLLNNIIPRLRSSSVEEAILIKNSTDPGSDFSIINTDSEEYRDDRIPKYKVAGLVFLPIWQVKDTANTTTRMFQTTGIRVAVALWQKDSTCNANNPDLLHIAGFEKVDSLVPPNTPAPRLNKFVIDLKLNPSVDYPEKDLINNVKEFDFVFLKYSRYKELATSTAFYPNGQGRKNSVPYYEGIAIERSLIGYDVKLTNIDTRSNKCYSEQPEKGTERLYYRTLYFSPDPAVEHLGSTPGRPAIAFEDAKRCPPYWTDNFDNRCDLHKSLSEVVCRIMKIPRYLIKYKHSPIPNPPTIGLHVGQSSPLRNKNNLILQGGNFFEISLEQYLWKRFISLETLIGRYQINLDSSIQKTWGVNVLLRGSLPLSKFLSTQNNLLNNSLLYVEGGTGIYSNLPNQQNFGTTGGVGFRMPIAFNDKYLFDLELGAQYQILSQRTDSNNSIQLISGKIGIKRNLW